MTLERLKTFTSPPALEVSCEVDGERSWTVKVAGISVGWPLETRAEAEEAAMWLWTALDDILYVASLHQRERLIKKEPQTGVF